MSLRIVFARVLSWALLAYATLSLGVAVWLLITGWPISTDVPRSRIAFFLCAGNLLLAALVVPDKAIANSFWPGLFPLRPESVRTIRRAVRFTHAAFWVCVVGLGVSYFASPGLFSPPVVESVARAGAVFMLVFLPLLLAAVAAVGQYAIRRPPAESRKGWFVRDVAD